MLCMFRQIAAGLFTAVMLMFAPACLAQASAIEQSLEALKDSPHASVVEERNEDVIDHEIGLGALRKEGGAWRFKESERYSGRLRAYTLQIGDSFTSEEVMQEYLQALDTLQGVELLFGCDGRACGHPSQWANRIFGQRVLYGRQDLQRYRVFSVAEDSEYRLLLYASARTADRQYLQVELLELTQP